MISLMMRLPFAKVDPTSVGSEALSSLTVDNIIINGTNIGHTSDTDAISIASSGVTTFSCSCRCNRHRHI